MRPLPALLLSVLGGCAPQDMVSPGGTARFTGYPQGLVASIESACRDPAQEFLRPRPDLIECREYLPAETTAALILRFDGTTQDLPQLVVRFRIRPDAPGYLVENDVFVNVPQKSGAAVQIRRLDSGFDRKLDALFREAGGVPE